MTDEMYSVAVAFIAVMYTSFLLYLRIRPDSVVHRYRAGASGYRAIGEFANARKLIFYMTVTLICVGNAAFAIYKNKQNRLPVLFASAGITFVICGVTFVVLYFGVHRRGE